MYCPRCGQQVIENTRFCSRCGFRMEAVQELITTEHLYVARQLEEKVKPTSERRTGIRRGAKVVFASLAVLPLLIGASIAIDTPGPLVIFFTTFMAGILLMLYYRIFGDDTPIMPKSIQPSSQYLLPVPSQHYLPNDAYISGMATPRRNTADMIQPPSVTEPTTNLLKEP